MLKVDIFTIKRSFCIFHYLKHANLYFDGSEMQQYVLNNLRYKTE